MLPNLVELVGRRPRHDLLPEARRRLADDGLAQDCGGHVDLIREAAERPPSAILDLVWVTVEEVRIARRTGFCYGVREAIDYARLAAAQGKPTHTLGQVVHNEGVIAQLEADGIETVDTLDAVDNGAAVVIRAHGVTPDVMQRAQQRGLEVIDGTCTWVIQEQRELQKLVEEGYTIVLLGTPRHPEVVGLLGFAPDAIVVDEEEDWQSIPRTKRMALISQSTQPPWKFERLAAYLVGRCHELKVVNTVCPVTIRRQQDTMELAAAVDVMVVVGGRNSANTKELTRLCEIAGTRVLQIEGERDLTDAAALGDARVVGVSGGTSTPIEDLQKVAQRIYELAGTDDGQGQCGRAGARGADGRRRACLSQHIARRAWSTAALSRRRRGLANGPTQGTPSDIRPYTGHAHRGPAGGRLRRSPQRRQEHPLQPRRGRARGDRRGSRADDA